MQVMERSFLVIFLISTIFVTTACNEQKVKKTAPIPQVTITQPIEKEITRYLEYTGTTVPIETVDIRARVTGFLQKILFVPQTKVKTNDLLFVIDPRQYQAAVDQAKAQVEANKASSKLAQTELQISQQLESKEAISALRLEKQSAQRDVTKADVDLAQANLEQANLNLEWTQVTSPINGRISRNLIDVGNLVNSAEKTLLATVVNDDSVYVYFNVSELDLLPIRRLNAETRGSTLADLKIPAFIALADESEFKHEGHLDYGDPRVNPSTGTIQVRGVFPNPDGLLMGGLFVRIRVPVEKKMSLTIPDIAVQVDQGGSFVYVLSKDDVVEQRRVKLGNASTGVQSIVHGLDKQDRVVVDGIQRIRPGTRVKPIKTEDKTQNNPAITDQK